MTPTTSPTPSVSCSSKALQFGVGESVSLPIRQKPASNSINTTFVPGLSVETFLGEGSGPNKRAHVEEVTEAPQQTGVEDESRSKNRRNGLQNQRG